MYYVSTPAHEAVSPMGTTSVPCCLLVSRQVFAEKPGRWHEELAQRENKAFSKEAVFGVSETVHAANGFEGKDADQRSKPKPSKSRGERHDTSGSVNCVSLVWKGQYTHCRSCEVLLEFVGNTVIHRDVSGTKVNAGHDGTRKVAEIIDGVRYRLTLG